MFPSDENITTSDVLECLSASTIRIGVVAGGVNGQAERLGEGKCGVVWSLAYVAWKVDQYCSSR